MTRCYLVTGATGVVGSAFAERVLRETDDSVRLLIRPKAGQSTAQRLAQLFRFWQLGAREASARARVGVIEGDTEAPHLGMTDEAWARGTKEVTHVVHAAAMVKMTLPLDAARRAAVGALENVVAFATEARAHRLQKVEVVSTVGVGGRSAQVLAEAWAEGPRAFHNTYEEAKFEAERVARRAVEGELALTVHRPSMVVGDSRSGKVISRQIFTSICDFLTGTRLHGLFPSLDRARLDVVPVDWVTALLLKSSQTPEWSGKVLHACSGSMAVPLVELRSRVQRVAPAHGRRVIQRATLPLSAFRTAAEIIQRLGNEGKRAATLLGILLSYLEDEQRFGNSQTVALASSVGLQLPAPSQYLDTVLHAQFSRG